MTHRVMWVVLSVSAVACSSSPAPRMVSIDPGTFLMGSPTTEPCRGANETLHQVTLTRGFKLGRLEVTNAEYEDLLGKLYDAPPEQAKTGLPNLATAYCNALSRAEGLEECYELEDLNTTCRDQFGCINGGNCVNNRCVRAKVPARFLGTGRIYDCRGYRLPTEAEWEYAYRAGTQTAYYSGPNTPGTCDDFFGGDDPAAAQLGRQIHNSMTLTGPGQLPPNPWGLYDMAGNAGETVHDSYREDLGSAAVVDPVMEEPSKLATTNKGGSAELGSITMRGAARGKFPSMQPLGFRVAITR